MVMCMYFRRISDLRNDNDKNQKEVADFLRLNVGVYGRYERGEREVPAWVIVKLAEYYATSADYILELTENPSKPHA